MSRESLWFQNIPPAVSGMHIVQSNAVDTAAESLAWPDNLSPAPKGPVMLAVEAVAQDIYVRFGSTSTTATTSSNGLLIKAGQPAVKFYCHPVSHRYIDHIAASNGGVLKVQVCSQIGERINV